MTSIAERLTALKQSLPPDVTLVAVSKTHPVEKVLEAYYAGQRAFGENRVQELVPKYEALPKDIEWHLIGHLQTNKVKYIAPFVHLIHSIDSLKLLEEVNKQAARCGRIINVLLQIFIADEETKFGFEPYEAEQLFDNKTIANYSHIKVCGLMAMATNTDDQEKIRNEFKSAADLFKRLKTKSHSELTILSMGMSSDWKAAISEGSNVIRVGSSIFGSR
ncbi:MAG: YggS family pyridoxal phosphate-dependent enzyme [Bacteroidia bacterium]